MYWVIGALGLAFIVSPFYFNYTNNTLAFWVSLFAGGIALVMAMFEWAAKGKERWEYWVVEVVGLIAIFSPFVLGFKNVTMALAMSVGIGLLLALFSASRLTYIDKKY